MHEIVSAANRPRHQVTFYIYCSRPRRMLQILPFILLQCACIYLIYTNNVLAIMLTSNLKLLISN